jgi:hypothetical protein
LYEIRTAAPGRTTYVELFAKQNDDATDATEADHFVCRDCRSRFPIKSFIPVDALHVQCPFCLYVFFMETSRRRML